MTTSLRIGTRGSPLALWQANHIAGLLRAVVAPRRVELVLIETHGDRDQASALSAMGGLWRLHEGDPERAPRWQGGRRGSTA